MRFALVILPLLASTASAGLFSDPKPDKAVRAPLFEGAIPDKNDVPSKKSVFDYIPKFDVETLLTTGPIAKLISKAGVNVTEKFEEAKRVAAETGWHLDIPLITDDNYKGLIVDEKLNEAQLEKRVWLILVTVPNDPLAKLTDEKFDATYNLTRVSLEKALPHVKFGRINYLDVTYLTTKWSVWKAPYLIVCRKQGQELRFYNPKRVRFVPEVMHRFLKEDGWKETKPWTGAFAPGGSLEQPLDWFAKFWTSAYAILLHVPKWLMMLMTGAVGSLIVNLLHRGDAPPTGSRGNKRARIASSAKKEDGGPPVKPISRQNSPEKDELSRSQNPSKRVSARIAARSESPNK
ncbi:hypothetical protein FRB95_009082 [Tulasnella sp. JGI-2019a]|nr:hypothetical protein FRB95_009082 [Tulasnella sp. JGI-2019a]